MPTRTKTPPAKAKPPAKRATTTTKTPPPATSPAKKTTTRKAAPKRAARKPTKGAAKSLLDAATGGQGSAAAVVLPLDAIDPDHFTNPRGPVDLESPEFDELVDSIRELDVLQPLVVGPALTEGGRHPLLAGWRRYHAAKAAGHTSVPVRQMTEIREAKDALAAAIAENVARHDMTPLAEARALDALMREHGLTQVAAGKRIGMSERTARERLRLLDVERDSSPAVAQAMSDGVVPVRAATWVADLAKVSAPAAERLVQLVGRGDLEAQHLASPPDGRFAPVLAKAGSLLVHYPTAGYGAASAGWRSVNAITFHQEGVKAAATKRAKAAKKFAAGAYFDDTLTLRDSDLEAGRAQGVVFTAPDKTVWITPGGWLDAAALCAINRMGDRAKTAGDKAAKQKTAAPGPNPFERAAREARAEEIAAHAVQGNADLAAAIMAARVNQRATGALFERLALEGCSDWRRVVDSTLALIGVELDLDDVDLLGRAADLVVRAYASAAYIDIRGLSNGAYGYGVRHARPYATAALACLEGFTPPERARRLLDARVVHERQVDAYTRTMDHCRVLHELEAGEPVALTVLMDEAAWHKTAPGRPMADSARVTPDLLEAMAGLIHLDEDAGTVTITEAGKGYLDSDLAPAPVIEDIDPPGARAAEPEPAAAPAGDVTSTSGAKKALAEIAKTPGVTVHELADRLQVKANTLYRILPALQKAGKIGRDGRGWHPIEATS